MLIVTKPVNIEKIEEQSLEEKVESYVTVRQTYNQILEDHAPLKKAISSLEKEFRNSADAVFPADEEGVLNGVTHDIRLGPKGNKVVNVRNKYVIDALGQDVFNELASVSISDLRKHLTPKQLAKALVEERTGARHIKVLHQKEDE